MDRNREREVMNEARVLEAVGEALERLYGDREEHRCAHGDPLEDLIETILSQNTSHINRRRAFAKLRATFQTWEEVLEAPREDLEEAIRPAGLARVRSGRIQRLLGSIQRERGSLDLDHLHDLSNDDAMRELLRYEGVGPKTAYCVLLFSMDRDVFPIDVHIHRILQRLAVIPAGMSVEKAHPYVLPFIAPRRHLSLHLNLISLGREICRPTRPNCRECPLVRFCRFNPA
jgi:endonuclease-3